MFFLIEFNKTEGKLVSQMEFDQFEAAREARAKLESELYHKGSDHEAVLLEASSLEALKKTHGRYFQTIAEGFGDLQRALLSQKN